jgi:hypothetical protein
MPTIYGFTGILLVLTLKLYPFIYLYVSGALKSIDVSLSEAAESLGCDPIKKVFTIILPLMTPTVLAGAAGVHERAGRLRYADADRRRLRGDAGADLQRVRQRDGRAGQLRGRAVASSWWCSPA